MLDYALEVEKITTSKKPNLILNVDGIIGVAFVDLLRNSGCFTRYTRRFFSVYGLFADGLFVCLPFRRREEAQEYIEIGTINGLFVLGRCTGFIGTCASGFNSAFSSVVLIHHHIYVFILLSFEQQQATIWIKSD